MTCVVGLADEKGRILVAADSAGVRVDDLSLTVRLDPKVFRVGDFVIGCAGSFRAAQVLRYRFTPPRPAEGQDVYAFMVTSFVDAVRAALRDAGVERLHEEVETGLGEFVVGYRSRVFLVEQDFQVAEAASGYASAGVGCQVARGALYATVGRPAKERIETALLAAQEHSAGVRGPFIVEVLEGEVSRGGKGDVREGRVDRRRGARGAKRPDGQTAIAACAKDGGLGLGV